MTALNGLPVFNWDGAANNVTSLYTAVYDLPTSGFPVTSTGYTFAVVMKRGHNATFSSMVVANLNDTMGGSNAYLQTDTDAVNCLLTHFGRTTSCAISVLVNEWQIVTGTFDFVEGIPRLQTNDDTAAGSVGAGSVFLNLALLIGANPQAIAEVLFYNTKLSDSDLAQLRTYLSEKWGIPITV